MQKNVLNTDLKDKVAVVTGAGGVLCSAFSKTLARAGAKVALLDLNLEAAEEFAKEIVAEGGIAKAYSCDVLDKSVCESVAEQVKKDLGNCDILINGAGGNNPRATTDKFGFEKVAITLRTSISANDNDWAGMLYDGEDYYFSKSYHLHIVDRVGGGDSFGGGLIYSLLSGKSSKQAIEFAVAASALKHTVEGDYNRVSVAEVEKLAGGDGSGRVQR